MLRNYLKTAFRVLSGNKVYSFINIAGLSLGLACTMLIMLYVKDEVSFDRFHNNIQNIYRIASISQHGQKMGSTGFLQGPLFTQHVAGIHSFVRVQGATVYTKIGNDVRSQEVLYADSAFFSVFSFPLLSGNSNTCLRDPHSIVISKDACIKYFGTSDAVGRILMIKQDSVFVPYVVSAVAKSCPQNSSIQFDVVLPIKVSESDANNAENWFGYSLNTFVVLNAQANVRQVEAQMQRYYVSVAREVFNAIVRAHGGSGKLNTYFLQPFSDLHLSIDLPAANGLMNAGNRMYSYILSGIGLFILLIACINFVNLTVARSMKRAKEIGVRKISGSSRRHLMAQFIGESYFLCTIAFTSAIALVQIFLPLFNAICNKALSLSYLGDAKLVMAYAGLYLLTGSLAGFYPALVLSGYSPIQTLYNRFQIAGKNYLQRSLIVLQFSLASFLIIVTFIMYAQFKFLTHTDLGYDDSDLVVIATPGTKHSDAAVFRNELLKNPNIVGVAAKNWGIWQAATRNAEDSGIDFRYETVDEHYLPLMKIQLTEGRNFSSTFPTDSNKAVIVNESFVKALHWKHPVGETVNLFWGKIEPYQVIGVVKDYHFASLSEKIAPQLFITKSDNMFGNYLIRIRPGTATASLSYIQRLFRRYYPDSPYSYLFKRDQNLKDQQAITKWKQMLLFSAALTIFISCIGLFGVSVFSAEKRKKEIGVRKVMGASVKNIVTTLSTDFIKLVALALIVATPLSYLAANKWLQGMPYRVGITWTMFATSGLIVIAVALLTVSFQSIRAATANPVKALRAE